MTIDEAWEILSEHQFKKTKNRQLILALLAQEDRYITPMEIRSELVKDNPGMSYDTVYRNLETFAELHIIEQTELNGEMHVRMQCGVHSHHHHFICKKCGKTETIAHCPVEQMVIEIPGHVILDHKFEIYGYCPTCA